MVPSHAAEQAVIAAQMIEALAAYERDMARLATGGLDADLALRVSESLDRMRLYASSLPKLSISWVELLISRFDLSQALWACRGGATSHRVMKLHAYHVTIIQEVRRKCQAYVDAVQKA